MTRIKSVITLVHLHVVESRRLWVMHCHCRCQLTATTYWASQLQLPTLTCTILTAVTMHCQATTNGEHCSAEVRRQCISDHTWQQRTSSGSHRLSSDSRLQRQCRNNIMTWNNFWILPKTNQTRKLLFYMPPSAGSTFCFTLSVDPCVIMY